MNYRLSIIICTHNPRKDYLNRVLTALKSQTMKLKQWELLLIDNASEQLLSLDVDLRWHPHARHLKENKLGLTHARIKGIKEAQAEILVFVDDDNVLDSDFLEITWQISQDWSILGAWGGQIRPEFEREPPEWTKPYWGMLAIREFDTDKWSNLVHQHETTPCGAGLCVRRIVAQKYAELVKQDRRRLSLDRKGELLTSCGDSDLAFTACDRGLGTGLFKSLKLTHLISANRVEEDYLLRLVKGITYSDIILQALRGKFPTTPCKSQKLFEYYCRWLMNARNRRFYDARKIGVNLALKEIAAW